MRTAVEVLLGRPEPPAGRRARLLGAAVVVAAAAAIAAAWLGPFALAPGSIPPGQDLAWYTWRATFLTGHPPQALIEADGPLGVFGGGYRVASPLMGALLQQVAGMDRFAASIFLVAGRQVVASLALGSVAYRMWPRPLVFVMTALLAAGVLFARPFLGVVDNVLALAFVTGGLFFVGRADRAGRTGLFLLTLVAYFAHPPVAGVFAAVVAGAAGLSIVAGRRDRGRVREELGTVAVVAGASVAAAALWWLGAWGVGRSFADAFHIAPIPAETFLDVVPGLLWALGWERLLALGIVGAAVLVAARRLPADPVARTAAVWVLPVLGVFGFLLDLRYPYKRALTGTLAPVLLAGVGAWALSGSLLRLSALRRALAPLALLAVAVAAAILVPAWDRGTGQYRSLPPWMSEERRAALASVSAYLERRPSDVVFVAAASPRWPANRIWGGAWRGSWSQMRAGLPAGVLSRTHLFLGSVDDLVAGRPTATGNPTLDLVSEAGLRAMRGELDGRRPAVFLLRDMNLHLGNLPYLQSPRGTAVGPGVSMVHAPGLAEPDPDAVEVARRAGNAAAASLEDSPGPLARPAEAVHGLLGIAAMLLPGLLAARWFGIRDLPSALGMVSVLALAMDTAAGIAVLAVVRQPVTPAVGWGVVAVAAGWGLALVAASRFRRTLGREY